MAIARFTGKGLIVAATESAVLKTNFAVISERISAAHFSAAKLIRKKTWNWLLEWNQNKDKMVFHVDFNRLKIHFMLNLLFLHATCGF